MYAPLPVPHVRACQSTRWCSCATEPTGAEAQGDHSVDCNDSDGTRGAPNTMVYFNDMDGRLRADKLTDHKVQGGTFHSKQLYASSSEGSWYSLILVI